MTFRERAQAFLDSIHINYSDQKEWLDIVNTLELQFSFVYGQGLDAGLKKAEQKKALDQLQEETEKLGLGFK